jgi:predicted PurR-regulated permease PerM
MEKGFREQETIMKISCPEVNEILSESQDTVSRRRRDLIVLVAVIALALLILHQVSSLVPLLILVIISFYVLNPLVERLSSMPRRKPLSRAQAALLSFLIVGLVCVLFLYLIVPSLLVQINTLGDRLPQYAEKGQAMAKEFYDSLNLSKDVQDQIQDGLQRLGSYWTALFQRSLQFVQGLLSLIMAFLFLLIMVPMLTFYLIVDHNIFYDALVCIFPKRFRSDVTAILRGVHIALQNFIRGQFLLCITIGIITSLAMIFILPQYALALGLVAAITEAIPIFGPILGALPAILIALVDDPSRVVWVIIIYVGIQQAENTFLVPRIMGESMGIHPVSVLLALLIFGQLFGFWGVFMALPATAIAKVIFNHIMAKFDEEDEKPAQSGPSPGAP